MWAEGHLLLDRSIADALKQDDSGKLFARVQRDLLENILLRRYFNDVTDIRQALPGQRRQVWRAIEQVESRAPALKLSDTLRSQICQMMAARAQLGRVQISPTIGSALGHSWIAPSLSLMPDHHQPKKMAGTCYMQSGFHVEPRDTIINEWPIRWLNLAESEQLYPAHAAWHQPVAVDALQLNLAAETLRREWGANNTRYRFADVSAAKPATGCRISVWETVRSGMAPAMREIFDRYNWGLCLPDSSTELWERLHNFMGWLEKIAAD
jgi:hypothetical protein